MGGVSCFVLSLRALQTVAALGIIGLGAFVTYLVEDARRKGLNTFLSQVTDPSKQSNWKSFLTILLRFPWRMWFSIAAGSTTLAIIIYLTLVPLKRLKTSKLLLIALEFLTSILTALSFAATLSLALELDPLCQKLTPPTPELNTLLYICPISKAHASASGFAWALTLLTLLLLTLETIHARRQKVISFEPTVSGLGMGHGYQTVPPQRRSRIPTLYDPFGGGNNGFNFGLAGKDERESLEMGVEEGEVMGMNGQAGMKEEGGSGVEKGKLLGAGGEERRVRPWSEYPGRK